MTGLGTPESQSKRVQFCSPHIALLDFEE